MKMIKSNIKHRTFNNEILKNQNRKSKNCNGYIQITCRRVDLLLVTCATTVRPRSIHLAIGAMRTIYVQHRKYAEKKASPQTRTCECKPQTQADDPPCELCRPCLQTHFPCHEDQSARLPRLSSSYQERFLDPAYPPPSQECEPAR